jgi:hypothetical protein
MMRFCLSFFGMFMFLAVCSCQGSQSLPNPIVRVDLRDKLPPALQRSIVKEDTSYKCKRKVTLREGEARQDFLITFRVLKEQESKYLTAVGVEPLGLTIGAASPTATAVVSEVKNHVKGKANSSSVSVQLKWSAQKGCSAISAVSTQEIAADDPTCQEPRFPGKLLVPIP